jgi:hypothetical protein
VAWVSWAGLLAANLVIVCAAAAPTLPDSSDASRGLDMTHVELTRLYEADFSKPLRLVTEEELFADERRVREPVRDADWVLEGAGSVRNHDGHLLLANDGNDVVLWNTRQFPADFLLEFGVIPHDAGKGLNIVFFAAMGRDGGGIFDAAQPRRNARFRTYHSGELNSYHVSYWATDPDGVARTTVHIRKNHGFHLVAVGRDFIAGQGPGPHRVRILKLNGNVQVEVDEKIAAAWQDDGRTFGSVLGEGYIGLRQMAYSQSCTYTAFEVWGAKPRAE